MPSPLREQFWTFSRLISAIFKGSLVIASGLTILFTLRATHYLTSPNPRQGFWAYLKESAWLDDSELSILVTTCGVIVALLTVEQKRQSDNRNAFYQRVQWCIELTLKQEHPEANETGWYLLPSLVGSALNKDEDKRFGQAIVRYIRSKDPDNVQKLEQGFAPEQSLDAQFLIEARRRKNRPERILVVLTSAGAAGFGMLLEGLL